MLQSFSSSLPQSPNLASAPIFTTSSQNFGFFFFFFISYRNKMLLNSRTWCLAVTIPLPGNYPSSSEKYLSSFYQSFSQVTSHTHFPFRFLAPLLSFNPAHITLAVNYLKQVNTCNKPAFCQTRACSEADTLKISLSWPSFILS